MLGILSAYYQTLDDLFLISQGSGRNNDIKYSVCTWKKRNVG